MVSRHHRAEQYELLRRASQESVSSSSDSGARDHYVSTTRKAKISRFSIWYLVCLPARAARQLYARLYRQRGSRGLILRGLCWVFAALLSITAVLVVFTAAFRPSYSHPPAHYRALRKRCEGSEELGRGNINNERIFIAATLYDPAGTLVGNGWGNAVLKLVELLGPQNVHLSVYENDATSQAKDALERMDAKVQCRYPPSYCLPEEATDRARLQVIRRSYRSIFLSKRSLG